MTPGSGPVTSARLDIRDETGAESDIQQMVAGEAGLLIILWDSKWHFSCSYCCVQTDKHRVIESFYHNGSAYHAAAYIEMLADSIPNGDAPGLSHLRPLAVGATVETQRMIIKHNGYVGIGTSTPSALLHLQSANLDTVPRATW